MKRTLLILATTLSISTAATSAPFLTCNPYPVTGPQPDSFTLSFDSGATIAVPARVNADASVDFLFDVAPLGINNGSHQFKVTANSSLWGAGGSVNFPFVRGLPSAPAGVGLKAAPAAP